MLDPEFEDVGRALAGPVRWKQLSAADLSTDHGWHFHPEFELTWFLSGSGTRFVSDRIDRYEGGDLVLLGPHTPHCWRNDRGVPAEWITVQFSSEPIAGLDELPEAARVNDLLDASRGGLTFDPALVSRVAPLICQMGEVDGLLRILRLLEILHVLTEGDRRPLALSQRRDRLIGDSSMVERLERIMSYIAAHFRGAVRQADLAAELGLTASAFSKFVRLATGDTFSGLVKRARIREACRLLAHSDARITDIALECGYQHTSHFDHHFLKIKGVRPTEYRRRARSLTGVPENLNNRPGNMRVSQDGQDP